MNKRNKCEIDGKLIFAILHIIGLAGILIYYYCRFKEADDGMTTYPHNGIREIAMAYFFDHFKTVSYLSGAGLTVLWGAWLFEKRIQLDSSFKKIFFFTTTLSLISSLTIYVWGQYLLLPRMFRFETFDLESPIVQLWSQSLVVFGIFSLISVGITLWLSVKKES